MAKVFVAYVPVVHHGLLKVVRAEAVPVWVMGEEFIAEFPELKHDLRAVKPTEAVTMLSALGISARLLHRDDLSALVDLVRPVFVLPTDEVMNQFAERYLTGLPIEYRRTFIRWDRVNTTSENEVVPDRLVTSGQLTRDIMRCCYEQAELSSDWWRQIGAAVVRDGQVLLYGVNRMRPTDYAPYLDGDIRGCFTWGERLEICGTIHAEAAVIATAAGRGIALAGADFYCTTFPCPGCARLLEAAKIGRVIYDVGYSVCDAFDILRKAGIEVVKLVP
ncbi:MAG: deaminase [Candidatus Paceibacterota bacterium]|jgi:dCMP deaminase